MNVQETIDMLEKVKQDFKDGAEFEVIYYVPDYGCNIVEKIDVTPEHCIIDGLEYKGRVEIR